MHGEMVRESHATGDILWQHWETLLGTAALVRYRGRNANPMGQYFKNAYGSVRRKL